MKKPKEHKSGIYKIINHSNGKVYIGQSYDLKARGARHVTDMRGGRHCNPHIQRAFDTYGEENFSIEVEEFCDPELLCEREEYYYKMYDVFNPEKGYNISKFTTQGNKRPRRVIPQEIDNEPPKQITAWRESLTAEEFRKWRKKISDTKQKKNPTIQWKCEICGDDVCPKAKKCEPCFRKTGGSTKGRKWTKEQYALYEIKKIDRKRPVINGVYYDCIDDAAKNLGVNRSTFSRFLCAKFENYPAWATSIAVRIYSTETDFIETQLTPTKNNNKINAANFYRRRPIINGVYFDNNEDAARYYGVKKTAIQVWVTKGYAPKIYGIKTIEYIKDDSLRPKYYAPPMPITDLGHLTNPI